MSHVARTVEGPETPVRRLAITGVYNLRDVGGYPTAAGGRVRWRTLFRSDALHRLDDAGMATVADLGVRTILDLRTQLEAEYAPTVLVGTHARTVHISILAGDLQNVPVELAAVYRHFVEKRGDRIGAAVAELCDPAAYPALVHCSAGKDRTGIVIALVLAVLGVPDELIAADYALSGGYLDEEHTPAIGQLQASTGLGDQLTRALLTSPPQLMLDTLAQVRARGGSVAGYLADHGVGEPDLARLRTRLAE
ncbi:MAG TPA: tyrosine-protein phosphatase [Streptosporangiaceae bacterium]